MPSSKALTRSRIGEDGRWAYTWDAEDRLVSMESDSAAPAGSKLKLDFAYDARGRRIQKIVSTNSGSGYVGQYTNRFVYDGWKLLAILNPPSSILASFTWGLDLSGSMQGAGGVGGLLMVHDPSTINNQPSTHFVAYDGNGNAAALVNAADGSVSAQYEYGPFGELLRATGPMAKANPFRFSTKYQDDETDLLYYGYRYYNASTGRWNSRDPISELGFNNSIQRDFLYGRAEELDLYAFARNNAVNQYDRDGRFVAQSIGALLTLTLACVKPQEDLAFEQYPFSSDRFKHCWVSCRLSKTCGGYIAELAGLGKETRDRLIAAYCLSNPNDELCRGNKRPGDLLDSLADLAANQKCIGWETALDLPGAPPIFAWAGALCRRSCEDCCKAKVGYH